MYFLKHKSDAASAFRSFLASVRADGKPSLVEIVRSDNGGEFFRGEFESCLLYTSPSPRDATLSRMPSSA